MSDYARWGPSTPPPDDAPLDEHVRYHAKPGSVLHGLERMIRSALPPWLTYEKAIAELVAKMEHEAQAARVAADVPRSAEVETTSQENQKVMNEVKDYDADDWGEAMLYAESGEAEGLQSYRREAVVALARAFAGVRRGGERERGRAALREFLQMGEGVPRRPMTEEERAFFAEHKRKRESGELKMISDEERQRRRRESPRNIIKIEVGPGWVGSAERPSPLDEIDLPPVGRSPRPLLRCTCSHDNQGECCPDHGRFATLQEAWDAGREHERAMSAPSIDYCDACGDPREGFCPVMQRQHETSDSTPTTAGKPSASGPSDEQAGTANAAAPSPGGAPKSPGATSTDKASPAIGARSCKGCGGDFPITCYAWDPLKGYWHLDCLSKARALLSVREETTAPCVGAEGLEKTK